MLLTTPQFFISPLDLNLVGQWRCTLQDVRLPYCIHDLVLYEGPPSTMLVANSFALLSSVVKHIPRLSLKPSGRFGYIGSGG
jgi:hypothetical protein